MKKIICLMGCLLFAGINCCFPQATNELPIYSELPAKYFRILDEGILRIENRLKVEPEAGLNILEAKPGWSHFASAILIPAVLFSKLNPDNHHYNDINMLRIAERIGDMLADEHLKGQYSKRGDSDWDTYMWMEAYRLLESSLGEDRRTIWRKSILENLSLIEPNLSKCRNYPRYNAPFIITSPNHFAIYASTLLVAGNVFGNQEWKQLAISVLRRFVREEQSADGYWGEHSQTGPTTGYDYLTETQIALYWEYTRDPEALNALRRSTDFHEYFTYPDGTPVETINDRNRYWDIPMWGQFGFSNFPDGRRYAAFLTNAVHKELDIQSISRIAQNALYFHEGNTESIPQDQFSYSHQMKIPAGIRKTGPWVVCLSGLIEPEDIINNFFLDRQGNFSIFHKKSGLIITGANSKHQPNLATFTETINNQTVHMPLSTSLQMNDSVDRLALAYNTFFAVLEIPAPSGNQIQFRFLTTYKWGDARSQINIQLVLKSGQSLETASGIKMILDHKQIDLSSEDLGGLITHNGWTLSMPEGARLIWPVFPFNPYADSPETSLDHAIGILSVPLKEEDQDITFSIDVR